MSIAKTTIPTRKQTPLISSTIKTTSTASLLTTQKESEHDAALRAAYNERLRRLYLLLRRQAEQHSAYNDAEKKLHRFLDGLEPLQRARQNMARQTKRAANDR